VLGAPTAAMAAPVPAILKASRREIRLMVLLLRSVAANDAGASASIG
jgi:hypothetical protein